MKKIISDKLPRIIKAKKKFEKEFNVAISNRGKEVFIEGSSEDEYLAEKAMDAINFGFPISVVFGMKKEEQTFEKINIKDYARSKNFERIRGRIVGKGGKALKVLSNLTNCFFEIKGNEVGIIGYPEDMKNAQEAIIMLVKGAKHGNVYAFLERTKPIPISDLGLKEVKK